MTFFSPMTLLGRRNYTLGTPVDEGDRIDPPGAGTDIGRDIAWSPSLGIFVLSAGEFSATNFMYSSPDAINWTQRTIPVTNRVAATTSWFPALGKFISIANATLTDACMISTDGINWTGFDLPTGANQSWDGVAYSPARGRLVAVSFGGGTTATRVMTSDDGGETWTLRTTPTTNGISWVGVCYSPALDRFCAVSVGSFSVNNLMTSDDGGETWTIRNTTTSGNWEEVAWSPKLGLFVAVRNFTSNNLITSPDGITWTLRTSGAVGLSDVIWVKELDIFLAVSRDATADANRIIYSANGIDWTVIDPSFDKGWKTVDYAHALGKFVAVEISDPISILTIPVNYS